MVLVSDKPTNPIVLTSLIAMAMHFLQAGRKHATLPGTEESITTTTEFITALFCQGDDHLSAIPKHPEAHLWPSEVVTLGPESREMLGIRLPPASPQPQCPCPGTSA